MDLWSQMFAKSRELVNKRADLESQLNDINNEITHLDSILSHLQPLAGIPQEAGSIAGLGITEAIRTILRDANTRMAAADVRRELMERGFDFTGQTQPMASIYKILDRLYKSEEVKRERDGHKVFFVWKPTEMKEEDIPF